MHSVSATARLGEAPVWHGRTGADDQILDVAIALERIYMSKVRSISTELQHRVAGILGCGEEKRCRMRRKVKRFRDACSEITHGTNDECKSQVLMEPADAFSNGSELTRNSVVKLLNEGLPPEGIEVLIEANVDCPEGRLYGAKTAVSGNANRNG